MLECIFVNVYGMVVDILPVFEPSPNDEGLNIWGPLPNQGDGSGQKLDQYYWVQSLCCFVQDQRCIAGNVCLEISHVEEILIFFS